MDFGWRWGGKFLNFYDVIYERGPITHLIDFASPPKVQCQGVDARKSLTHGSRKLIADENVFESNLSSRVTSYYN